MKPLIPLLATALLVAFVPTASFAGSAQSGALPVPANRIVGSWSNAASVGPCGGAPGESQRQTIVFSAGGTFLDNPRFPPQGLPNLVGIAGTHQRSIGIGTWSYDPETTRYTVEQRFDWYVNNSYHGFQVVRRSILLSGDGQQAAGPVRTTRYAANGSIIVELCGSAVSTRF